jgi:GNAT superfamily N-acetyltransferase
MPNYRIVDARPRDLHLIGAIELAAAELLRGHAPDTVLNETTREQNLRDAQSQGRLWVALARDTPVGFAHVEVLEPNAAHLQEIDVHPDHGRRGLGRRLVAEVCGWAEERGYLAVTLTTFRDIPWNMPFYARLGFEEIPTAALSPALRSVLQDEDRRGLDPARRVAMRWLAQSKSAPAGACPRDHRHLYVRKCTF